MSKNIKLFSVLITILMSLSMYAQTEVYKDGLEWASASVADVQYTSSNSSIDYTDLVGLQTNVNKRANSNLVVPSATLGLAFLSGSCSFLNENFSANPPLSNTDVNGAWYPDRYSPAAFVSDASQLKISIIAADGAQVRPAAYSSSFYNTQGRKFNQCSGCVSIAKADLYIPADWETKIRRSDLWATAFDVSNAISYYPIIGFRNVTGSNPQMSVYNGAGAGSWIELGPPAAYNISYTLEIRLNGPNLQYLINGTVVQTLDSDGSVQLGNVMLQAYNFNDNTLGASYDASGDNTYDAIWDNMITTGTGGNVVTNTTTSETFCSIQAAIDAASTLSGHVISVGAGTYNESVIVNKSLTILGPNSGISPNGGTRVAEAVLVNLPTGRAFSIYSGNTDVTVSGFKFDGGSPIHDGNDTNNPKTSDVTFSKNSVVNSNAIYAGTSTSWADLVITDNKFQDVNATTTASAMQLSNTNSTTVTGNTFNNVNYAAILIDGTPTVTISGNTIDGTGSQGIQLAGVIGNATISSNRINDANRVLQNADRGAIRLYGSNFTGAVSITNNEITGGYNGIAVRNGENITGKNITITNNSITSLTSGKAIYHGGTGVLSATCNWFGSTNYTTVDSRITGKVVFVPYSTSDGGLCDEKNAIPASLALTYTAAGENVQVQFNVTQNDLQLRPIPLLNPAVPADLVTIAGLYNDLKVAIVGGNPSQIQAAALAVGDDIITEYYYMNGMTKVYLKTAGGNDLVKNKYWDRFLVRTSNSERLPEWGASKTLITKDLYNTSTNPLTGAVSPGWLNNVLGKDLHVDVTFVHNGSVTTVQQTVAIGLGPVNVYSALPIGPATFVSSHIKIQAAIDAATTLVGHIIVVDAGTYNESDILITKAGLTLIGAGQGNTIIKPDPTKLDVKECHPRNGTPHNGFMVAADNVTIKGLTIDGGANKDYRNGVVSKYWGSAPVGNYASTTVENVTVTQVNMMGIYLVSLTTKSTGHVVKNCTTINGGTSTCPTYPQYGIAGYNVDIQVKDCNVENWTFGISTGSSGPIAICNITGNIVKNVELQAYTLTLNGPGSVFSGNTANFTNTSNVGTGLVTYEIEDVMITGNTFTGAYNGISVGSQNKPKAKLVFGSGNVITGLLPIRIGSSGLIARDDSWPNAPRNFKVTGTTITGYETGVLISPVGTMTCDADFNGNQIFGNNYGLRNLFSGIVNAENNWWGHATEPLNTPNNTCGLGNEVSSNVDFTPWWTTPTGIGASGTLAVHNTTMNTYYCKIQAAIDAANPNDVIQVGAGTYVENLTFTKSVTLLGANSTISPNPSGSRVPETVLMPSAGRAVTGNAASSVIIKGFTFDQTNSQGADGHFVYQIGRANTTWNFEKNIFQKAGENSTAGNWYISGSTGLALTMTDNLVQDNLASNGISIWGSTPFALDVQNNVWEDNGAYAFNLNGGSGNIKGNIFRETRPIDFNAPGYLWYNYQGGILLSDPGFNLNIVENEFSRVHSGVILYADVAGMINIKNNLFDGTYQYSIRASNSEAGSHGASNLSAVIVTENSLINYNGVDKNISNVRADNALLTTTCNWFESADPVVVQSKVSANVSVVPYLINGMDNDLVTSGFQPVPGNCTGNAALKPNLSPTNEIDNLSFPANSERDFVSYLIEVSNVSSTDGSSIIARISRLGAFDITIPGITLSSVDQSVASSSSDVGGGILNNNGDLLFRQNASNITITTKPGVIIPAGGAIIIGLHVKRKPSTAQNTAQNITTTILSGSGGETPIDDNVTITTIFTSGN
jgi:hypothetical protein